MTTDHRDITEQLLEVVFSPSTSISTFNSKGNHFIIYKTHSLSPYYCPNEVT